MDNANTKITIPGFSIIEGPLGGGMALVYIAQQELTRRKVAIKLIQPRLQSSDNMAQYATRFRREAVFQANLQSPHIATLYEIGFLNDQPYIVMEYLPGGDLDKKIRDAAEKPITILEALQILRQVAMALQVAHYQGVIHRDVKPANILFRSNGDAVLTDFGIAKATADACVNQGITYTLSDFAMGTPRYMSPEQLRANQDTSVGIASDLYSLGATFYHVLTGRPPYQADTYMGLAEMHFSAPVPRLPKQLAPLDELIQRTMAKHPRDRFPSAAALIQRIDAIEKYWRQKRPSFLRQVLRGNAPAANREDSTRADQSHPRTPASTGQRRYGRYLSIVGTGTALAIVVIYAFEHYTDNRNATPVAPVAVPVQTTPTTLVNPPIRSLNSTVLAPPPSKPDSNTATVTVTPTKPPIYTAPALNRPQTIAPQLVAPAAAPTTPASPTKKATLAPTVIQRHDAAIPSTAISPSPQVAQPPTHPLSGTPSPTIDVTPPPVADTPITPANAETLENPKTLANPETINKTEPDKEKRSIHTAAPIVF